MKSSLSSTSTAISADRRLQAGRTGVPGIPRSPAGRPGGLVVEARRDWCAHGSREIGKPSARAAAAAAQERQVSGRRRRPCGERRSCGRRSAQFAPPPFPPYCESGPSPGPPWDTCRSSSLARWSLLQREAARRSMPGSYFPRGVVQPYHWPRQQGQPERTARLFDAGQNEQSGYGGVAHRTDRYCTSILWRLPARQKC